MSQFQIPFNVIESIKFHEPKVCKLVPDRMKQIESFRGFRKAI